MCPRIDAPAIPTIDRKWNQFVRRLTDVLRVLEPDEYLILSHPRSHHFVQFAAGGDEGMRGEAKSNHFISKRHWLTPGQELRLVELGWKAPTHSDGEEAVPDGSPNWFRDWEVPVPLRAAAEVAVMTLREVYGVRTPASLRYQAFRAGGVEVRLPTLGVRPDSAKKDPTPPRPEWLDELRKLVSTTMLERLPMMGMRRVDNGDLLVEGRDVTIMVRELDDPFRIFFYAAIVNEMEETPELLAALNIINAELVFGRVSFGEGLVSTDWAIPASTFLADQFVDTVLGLQGLVPRLRERLAELLGMEEGADADAG